MKGENKTVKTQYGHDGRTRSSHQGVLKECSLNAVPDEVDTCERDRCTTPSDTRLIAPPPDPQRQSKQESIGDRD
jgi:hypothetical protein